MQTRLLPTKGQGIHREGSIMTVRSGKVQTSRIREEQNSLSKYEHRF